MKQPKKLTMKQKKFLTKRKYDCSLYSFIKEDKTSIIFFNKKTNEQLRLEKN
ncbi:DUF6906 family protein [Clostridium perfringens]|uniref:DUF6906 domain-containing protein n=2 Tax=Clostridium perfringens TaxID=1502 RepID=A0AAP7BUZ0_CLOPF|nr:hypothetical protein [Clostridium perfringens]EDT22802.1 hypothetical protein AC1_2247 [Clostridium perfringens B str. ATCC 3626]NGU29525.1 hypothetical protein [Clostridium perfringens]WEV04517.1 hypothetical protein PL322_10890 [Clostridium perfringens B]